MEEPEVFALEEQTAPQEAEPDMLTQNEKPEETACAGTNVEVPEIPCAVNVEEKQVRVNPPVPPGGRSRMGRRRRHRKEETEI